MPRVRLLQIEEGVEAVASGQRRMLEWSRVHMLLISYYELRLF